MARSFQTWRASFNFEAAGTTVRRLSLSVLYYAGQLDEQGTDSSPDDVNFDPQSTNAKTVAISPVQASYFRSSTSQTSELRIFRFIEYQGITIRANGLVESFIFWVDHGPNHGKAQLRMRVTNIPENSIPSEERVLVQAHLSEAVSLIPQQERDYLRGKYGLDVDELFWIVVDARCCDNQWDYILL